jgi:uncharacterized protein (DUF952 family)
MILHLCPRQAWEEAQKQGGYRADSMESEGFIHCSRLEQILQVANHYYQGLPDVVLLWIDPLKVKPEIRWEPSGEDIFPHIYGPLNLEAVVAVSELSPEEDGTFRMVFGPG